jgi:hypothetical protein
MVRNLAKAGSERIVRSLPTDARPIVGNVKTCKLNRDSRRLPGEPQASLRGSGLLRVPDFEDDLAGLMSCARKYVLRLARL